MNRQRDHIIAAVAQLRGLLRDRSGGTLIWFALTVPVMLGMAGVGVDAALWFMDRRIIQTASDSGAIAGAHALAQGGTDAEAKKVVETEIARNDFAKAAADVITVNMPPLSGPNAGAAGFVEVIIAKQRPLYFAGFFRDAPVVIQSRAVSGQRPTASEHCILSLDKDVDSAIIFSGTADSNINCGVGANSRSSKAIDINGGALVDVDYIEAYGDIDISNNATLIFDSPPKPYSNYIHDPYANLEIPADSPCDETDLAINGGTVTLDPGRYCGGIKITGGADVTFNPGLYIIDGGDFDVNSDSTIYGDGVTFILTADDPANIGTLKFNGNSSETLIAPSDDGNPYVGVLFFQDPRAPTYTQVKYKGSYVDEPIKNVINGGAYTDLRGAFYFPSQQFQFTGGSDNGDGCMQVIARTLRFSGNANIMNSEEACADLRVKSIERMRVALVE